MRAVVGEKAGFAYSDQIDLIGLEQSACAARGIAQQGQNAQVQALKWKENQVNYCEENPYKAWNMHVNFTQSV